MPAKSQKTSEASGSKKRPAPRVVDEEEPEDEDEVDQDGPTQSGGAPPCDLAQRDRIAREMARLFLFTEHTRKGLTRLELRKLAMDGVKDNRGKIFAFAFARAREKLQAAFGYDIVQLQSRNAMETEAEAVRPTAAGSQGPAAAEAQGTLRYILVNKLPPSAYKSELGSVDDAEYQALVLVVIGLIRHSSNQIEESKVFEHLKCLGLDKKAKNGKFGSIDETITKRMVKDLYILVVKGAKDGDEHRKIIEGPRAKNEISDEAWTGYMQALGLRTAG